MYQNDALSFVELEMKSAGVVTFGTDLENPDFAELADACGIFGKMSKNPETWKAPCAKRSPIVARRWSA